MSPFSLIKIHEGAITKGMTTIEEIDGVDVLCSDKTGTFTLNKHFVDKSMIKVNNQFKSLYCLKY